MENRNELIDHRVYCNAAMDFFVKSNKRLSFILRIKAVLEVSVFMVIIHLSYMSVEFFKIDKGFLFPIGMCVAFFGNNLSKALVHDFFKLIDNVVVWVKIKKKKY